MASRMLAVVRRLERNTFRAKGWLRLETPYIYPITAAHGQPLRVLYGICQPPRAFPYLDQPQALFGTTDLQREIGGHTRCHFCVSYKPLVRSGRASGPLRTYSLRHCSTHLPGMSPPGQSVREGDSGLLGLESHSSQQSASQVLCGTRMEDLQPWSRATAVSFHAGTCAAVRLRQRERQRERCQRSMCNATQDLYKNKPC